MRQDLEGKKKKRDSISLYCSSSSINHLPQQAFHVFRGAFFGTRYMFFLPVYAADNRVEYLLQKNGEHAYT